MSSDARSHFSLGSNSHYLLTINYNVGEQQETPNYCFIIVREYGYTVEYGHAE